METDALAIRWNEARAASESGFTEVGMNPTTLKTAAFGFLIPLTALTQTADEPRGVRGASYQPVDGHVPRPIGSVRTARTSSPTTTGARPTTCRTSTSP